MSGSPSITMTRMYRPPYPVYFYDADGAGGNSAKTNVATTTPKVKVFRPYSAPLIRTRTDAVLSAFDFDNGFTVEVQHTGTKLKSRSLTPSASAWQHRQSARKKQERVSLTMGDKRADSLHRLSQPTFASRLKIQENKANNDVSGDGIKVRPESKWQTHF